MSSDDSGFDKEAEREKLREKYERDEEGRENTRRMSELLLQGATMTGKHCNRCGDPIFRYDGREFCPTCQQAGDASGADEASVGPSADAEPSDAGGESAADRRAASGDDGRASADDSAAAETEPRVEIDGVSVADRHVDRSDVRRPPSQQDDRSGRARDHSHERGSGRGARTRDPGEGPAGGRPRGRDERARAGRAGASDLGPARESLVRTLTDLSRRAEEADDAARARDLLAATREAAEALAALDRANR
ncbi:Sjogren's syndrome/scleroderma autoantigen 1 family protein [Halorussus halobius]|uniref:Sjogren's syndrome/scleroderma autoantigen 1 family protein n=1 Tax=Halorussus halobius TaxID=1710537 RepID=UPI0010927FCF|nr:Sjogren's syndrome/scleroderma autoantigen 1 family protein [Halorussus halobius]